MRLIFLLLVLLQTTEAGASQYTKPVYLAVETLAPGVVKSIGFTPPKAGNTASSYSIHPDRVSCGLQITKVEDSSVKLDLFVEHQPQGRPALEFRHALWIPRRGEQRVEVAKGLIVKFWWVPPSERPLSLPVPPGRAFAEPEDALMHLLGSIRNRDLDSVLNCRDFRYGAVTRSISMGTEKVLRKLWASKEPSAIDELEGFYRRRFIEEMGRLGEVLSRSEHEVASKHAESKFRYGFSVRFALPNGRTVGVRAEVMKLGAGWRVTQFDLSQVVRNLTTG